MKKWQPMDTRRCFQTDTTEKNALLAISNQRGPPISHLACHCCGPQGRVYAGRGR